MFYSTHTVKNSPELESLAYCCAIQDSETLDSIKQQLNDDDITSAIFDTSNGDYDNLHINYGYPSFRHHDTWHKVECYHSARAYLADVLPHGSGIDSDWYITIKGDKIIASNSYHVMCNGYYVQWVNFKVTLKEIKNKTLDSNFKVISVTLPDDRKVMLTDDDGLEYNDISSIRDYLRDSINEVY